MALSSIPVLEVLVAELIALILLVLAGARLILHDWHALLRSRNDGDHEGSAVPPQRFSGRADSRRKANQKARSPKKRTIRPSQ